MHVAYPAQVREDKTEYIVRLWVSNELQVATLGTLLA
jgi:hypothetical protein